MKSALEQKHAFRHAAVEPFVFTAARILPGVIAIPIQEVEQWHDYMDEREEQCQQQN